MQFLQKIKDLFTKPSPPQSNTYFLTPTNKLSTPVPSNYMSQPPPIPQPFTPFIPNDFTSMPFMPQPPIMNSLEMYGPGSQPFNPPPPFAQSYNDKSRQSDTPTNVYIPDKGRKSRNHTKAHRRHKVRSLSRSRHRNYSAEWAVNHPEVLTDFFVKSQRKRDTIFPPNNEIITVRTVKEKIHRTSHKRPVSSTERIPRRELRQGSLARLEGSRQRSMSRRNSRRRSTSRRRSRLRSTSRRDSRQRSTFQAKKSSQQDRESSKFHWKPVSNDFNIKDNVDERSDVSYDALNLSETDVITPENMVPKAPQLPSNFNTPPKKTAVDKKIYGSTRQNKIYENVVGELKDKITKLQGNVASSAEHVNSIAPSNLLSKPPKISAPKVDPKFSMPTNPEEELKQHLLKGIQLRHVSPPAAPSLGRVIPPPRPSPPKNYTSNTQKTFNAEIKNNFKPIRDEAVFNSGERPVSHKESKPPMFGAAAFSGSKFAKTQTPSSDGNYTSERDMEKTFLKSVENILMNKEGSRFKQPDGTEWEVIVVRQDSNEYENTGESSDDTSSTISIPSMVKSYKPIYLASPIFDIQSPVKTVQDKNIVSIHDFIGPAAFTS